MNIYATKQALEAWDSLRRKERARTLAATYFAPAKKGSDGSEDKEYKKAGIQAIVQAAELEDFCPQWQKFLELLPRENSRTITATLQSRLLVNLSGGILENAGIALEHISGVPVIPGSAVKGAARRYAIALLQEAEDAQKEELLEKFIAIFGCVEQDFEQESDLALAIDADTLSTYGELYGKRRGEVCFMQAVPKNAIKLCADVLTPHHKKYMAGDLAQPTDDEDPEPSYFPAVESGKNAVYTFALCALQNAELLDTAEAWLTQALTLFGIGAKGAAGYGYFSVLDKSLQAFTPEQQEGLKFVLEKNKLEDLFKTFAKNKDKPKEYWKCWALLYTISLPESNPNNRVKKYLEFLSKAPKDKKELKQKEKAIVAMQEMAAAHNLNLPQA